MAESQAKMILGKCRPLEDTEEARITAELVNEFTQETRRILERHNINERRKKEGRLMANVILTRDAGSTVPSLPHFSQQYGLDFVCLADMPVERGIAKISGMDVADLPPPSKDSKKTTNSE